MLKNKILVLVVSIIYSTLLVYLTFGNVHSIVPDTNLEFQDKIFHFLAYSGLSFLWCYYSFLIQIKKGSLKVFLATFFFGIISEFLQEKINPMRHFDVIDLIANCLGVMFGTIIVVFGFKIRKLKY